MNASSGRPRILISNFKKVHSLPTCGAWSEANATNLRASCSSYHVAHYCRGQPNIIATAAGRNITAEQFCYNNFVHDWTWLAFSCRLLLNDQYILTSARIKYGSSRCTTLAPLERQPNASALQQIQIPCSTALIVVVVVVVVATVASQYAEYADRR
jgi:hypothetical protein